MIQMTAQLNLKYHHIGLPTTKERKGESYNQVGKFYASAYFDSRFGIEWMRFTKESDLHPLIQLIPHLAFEIDDIRFVEELGYEVILQENPVDGVQVRFIDYHGIPIEFLQFDNKEAELWPSPKKRVFNGEGQIPNSFFKYEKAVYQGLEAEIKPDNPFGIQILKEEKESNNVHDTRVDMAFLANEGTFFKEGQNRDDTIGQLYLQENDLSIRLIMA